MAWEQPVRRFGGLLSALSLLGVAVALIIYWVGWAPERSIQLGVGSLIAGILGAMLLLLASDTLPPGGPPTAP